MQKVLVILKVIEQILAEGNGDSTKSAGANGQPPENKGGESGSNNNPSQAQPKTNSPAPALQNDTSGQQALEQSSKPEQNNDEKKVTDSKGMSKALKIFLGAVAVLLIVGLIYMFVRSSE